MSGSRLQRGFRRIGIGLAVPCLVAAVVAIGFYAISSPVNWWEAYPLAPKSERNASPRVPTALPTKGYFDDIPDAPPSPPALEPGLLPDLPPGFVIDSPPSDKQPKIVLIPTRPGGLAKKTPAAARPLEPLYWAAGFTAAGGLLFTFFAGFGWVLAGFARD